jgi:hypothetical protein
MKWQENVMLAHLLELNDHVVFLLVIAREQLTGLL